MDIAEHCLVKFLGYIFMWVIANRIGDRIWAGKGRCVFPAFFSSISPELQNVYSFCLFL